MFHQVLHGVKKTTTSRFMSRKNYLALKWEKSHHCTSTCKFNIYVSRNRPLAVITLFTLLFDMILPLQPRLISPVQPFLQGHLYPPGKFLHSIFLPTHLWLPEAHSSISLQSPWKPTPMSLKPLLHLHLNVPTKSRQFAKVSHLCIPVLHSSRLTQSVFPSPRKPSLHFSTVRKCDSQRFCKWTLNWPSLDGVYSFWTVCPCSDKCRVRWSTWRARGRATLLPSTRQHRSTSSRCRQNPFCIGKNSHLLGSHSNHRVQHSYVHQFRTR